MRQDLCNIELTINELAVLNQFAKGYTKKEAAENLGKSFNSIHQFTRRLYKKLRVHSRLDLIKRALELKLIPYSALTKKFRERFCRPKHEEVTIELREPLTDEELNYLKLVIEHNTKKQIIEKLNILNVNFCNYIAWNICCKLNARNMTQAAYHAGKLGIV